MSDQLSTLKQESQSLKQENKSLKQQNSSLKNELKSLKQKHEYTIIQLSDIKQKEQKLKQMNDVLIKNLQQNTIKIDGLNNINLVVQGQFTSQKINQLQRQLDKYKNGVNSSVDRRVREAIQEYHKMQEEQKCRKNADCNNFNINYHLVNKNGDNCQLCMHFKSVIRQKDQIIQELHVQLEEEKADNSILSAKLNKMEALMETLKQENQILNQEISRLQLQLSQEKQFFQKQCSTDRTYIERPPKLPMRVSSLRSGPSEYKDKENMMREIANIASGFNSSRKVQEERSLSRVMPNRDNNTLFSIKNGINRPNQLYL